MSSAIMEAGVDNSQVSAYWNEQFARNRVDNTVWINNKIIFKHIANLISNGNSSGHWLKWLLTDYFRDRPPFERSFSICCGDGFHELMLRNSNKVKFVRGFDISEGAIRQANEKFAKAGASPDSYLFEIKDANNLDVNDRVDLVLSTGALHHVTDLEGLLDKIEEMLEPGGYFVLVEFVGPNRFQWTQQQCDLINGALAVLDPQYLKDGKLLTLSAPPIEEMLRIDPSEAVRSEDILPLLRERFHVEYEQPFNGTLMHMLFPLMNGDISNTGDKGYDTTIRLLLYFEGVLVRTGVLRPDFTFMICRPRSQAEKTDRPAVPAIQCVGSLDICSPTEIMGWAMDIDKPNRPLVVDIRVNDELIDKVCSNGYRADVRAAGFGNGLSGFAFRFPLENRPRPGSEVKVFVAGTTTLIGSRMIAA